MRLVHYTVDLWVDVDEEKREVLSVTVDDGSARFCPEHTFPETGAERIAEEADWPAWEIRQ